MKHDIALILNTVGNFLKPIFDHWVVATIDYKKVCSVHMWKKAEITNWAPSMQHLIESGEHSWIQSQESNQNQPKKKRNENRQNNFCKKLKFAYF